MRFRVVRQDDNGVRSVMATFAARADADAMAATYEARAHKQMYWVEVSVDDASPADPQPAVGLVTPPIRS